ncbi:MAG: hypothetical protein ACLQQ4_07850 [Bacteroidia bacterium]
MTKSKEQELQKFDGRDDGLDPRYIFSLTATKLLSEALKGEFDLRYLAGRELANRGLDKNGTWVGFPKAKEIHGIR